jgi:lysozyme
MNRTHVGSIILSAAALVGLATSEGYEPVARSPLPGDKLTLGFGATENVRAGETTTPVRALVRLLQEAGRYEKGVQRCVHVPLYQHEFDAYVSFAYNVGLANFCSANFVKKLNAGDYEGACNGMATHPDGSPAWSYFQGVYVEGLQKRRQRERDQCLGRGP